MAAAVAEPNGQRRAPEALASQQPIRVARQPAPKASFLNLFRVPADSLVQGCQVFLEAGGCDVPAVASGVEEGGVAAPAVGRGMVAVSGAKQQPAHFEVASDERIGFLKELAPPGCYRLDEPAVWVNDHEHRQVIVVG